MPKKFTGYIAGQTPLDPNEIEGLIPDHITLLSELNELEQANITKAIRKYLKGRRKNWDLTDPLVLRKTHADMFSDMWDWAGKFRKTEKNIGVAPEQISQEMRKACDDFEFWQDKQIHPIDEIALRFHRLVSIHPFANGNGRFTRLVADIFLRANGQAPFSWGGSLEVVGRQRSDYLGALLQADDGELKGLLEISRK